MVRDEWRHLRRNRLLKVVLALLVCLMPVTLVASGTLASRLVPVAVIMLVYLSALTMGAMIATSLIADVQQGIPVLYAVRPIPRTSFPLARAAGQASALLAATGLGLAGLFLVNEGVVKAPLAWGPILRGLVLLRVPGVLLAVACGTLIGVASRGLAAGIAGFLVLANLLAILMPILSERLVRWTGCPAARADGVQAGLTALVAVLLLAGALRTYARRSI
ncbi:hypothetical protein [Mesoterricola sediminis]|nr:hypothetical protein [Mesoterricola sediminis]